MPKRGRTRWIERNEGLLGLTIIISHSTIILVREKPVLQISKLLASGRAATPGALFEIDEETLEALDRKEGHPNPKYYQRKIVTAYTADGKAHQAYTYIHCFCN